MGFVEAIEELASSAGMEVPREAGQATEERGHQDLYGVMEQAANYYCQQLKQHPEDGKYFTAVFCRYSPVVYTLIRHSARSTVQSEYLFALTWRHILYELSGLDLPAEPPADFSLQAWLVNLTAASIAW